MNKKIQKEKFELTSQMISLDKSKNEKTISDLHPREEIAMVNLSLKVPKEFAKEFKIWCTMREITMSKAIQDIFARYKKNL